MPDFHTHPQTHFSEVTAALAKCISAFTSDPTWETLRALLAFPKIVLGSTPKSRAWSASTVQHMRSKALDYCTDMVPTLWGGLQQQHTQLAPRLPRKPSPTQQGVQPGTDPDARKQDQITRLVGEGAYSKAVRHLTSLGVHNPEDPMVLGTLRQLHPTEPVPERLPTPVDGRFSFSDDPKERAERTSLLLTLIRKFPKLSGSGPSGLSPDRVKECLAHADAVSTHDLLTALDIFVGQAVRGTSLKWPHDSYVPRV